MVFKKILAFIVVLTVFNPCFYQVTQGVSKQGEIHEGGVTLVYRNVTVFAPAVAKTSKGYVGVVSTITVTIQSNGSGRVFVDTSPLTQVDMQGSARLAVKVAGTLVRNDKNCNIDPSSYDYFFVVRTDSPIIGGPSAGAVMTVATVALLENWSIDDKTMMTGMINPDGSIGPVGGITHKVDAAYSVGATRFLIPKGQGTYTEMVTKTERSNGWIRTITTPVTRNVADYAMSKYGIKVLEIADIKEAIENFTGHTFLFEESESEISTEDYNESMKPLAASLLDEAKRFFENASLKFNNTNIPNNWPTYYKNDVKARYNAAKDALEKSQEWYDKHLYYSSMSKSFQSLIDSRFVIYTCEYYESGDKKYIEDLLGNVQAVYDNASEKVKNAKINGFISLQSVGAAQERVFEAKTSLEKAKQAYENNELVYFSNVMDFLYEIAFVVERSNSVNWWINIGTKFNDTGGISINTVENLALEYRDEAQQATVYSSILLSEMGSTYGASANYLNDAESLLDDARDNLDSGYPAAALFESLEALVKANLAIEIIGTTAEEKIPSSREKANNNIARDRKQGIEPVLAVSYYEYAESLSNDSSFDSALMYYKLSSMIAGALSFTNATVGAASSRYVGISMGNPTYFNIWGLEETDVIIIAILIGGLAGLGVGLIICGLSQKKENGRKKENIREYIRVKPKQDYPGGEIPRSIRDYYKKNK